MRSSLARSAPIRGALLAALLFVGCGIDYDDVAPGIPPDFQRRGPPEDGSVIVVRDLCDASTPAQPDDAAITDAFVTTDAHDAFISEDSGAGCAFVTCNPGFLCCALDARCYPVSCFDCCGFFPDAGTAFPF